MSEIAGSNLVNMTLVLGGVLLTSSLAVDKVIFAEIVPFTVLSSLLLWYFLVKQGGIPQYGGITFILLYVIFQAVL
jgi:Ca2+/Na+ antiporter